MLEGTGLLLNSIADIRVEEEASLRPYTGFRTGGVCAFLVMPENLRALCSVLQVVRERKEKYYILGNGSNVLAPEGRYDGCVIRTTAMSDIELLGDGAVYSGAGVTLAQLCRVCCEAELSGLEFAYGIPGTVGGAVYMNAGAYGGELRDVVTGVRVIDAEGQILELTNGDMKFGYRTSAVRENGYVVVGATVQLHRDAQELIRARMEDVMQRRVSKQPLEYPSCGSTFKRPVGGYASALIEQCGLRGVSVGGAMVSDKHCGFLINRGGATSDDVFALIRMVQDVVLEKSGFSLEKEVQVLE